MIHNMRTLRTRLLLAISFVAILAATLLSQNTADDRKEQFRTRSIDAETKGLAEPFKGITTNGSVEPGLFAIKSTGVSTEPVRKAADAFLAVLTKEQRDKTVYPVDDPE